MMGGISSPPSDDGFSTVSFTPGPLVGITLDGNSPVTLKQFTVRANQICSDGSRLYLDIIYYGSVSEQAVRSLASDLFIRMSFFLAGWPLKCNSTRFLLQ